MGKRKTHLLGERQREGGSKHGGERKKKHNHKCIETRAYQRKREGSERRKKPQNISITSNWTNWTTNKSREEKGTRQEKLKGQRRNKEPEGKKQVKE